MKLRLCFLLVFVALIASSAFAQIGTLNYTPAAEAFGGFSLHRTQFGDEMRNAPGFVFSFGYNPASRLRLLADFGGQYHDTQVFLFDRRVATSNYQLLFGPELVLRNRSRYTPFVHAMVGWATRRYNVPTGLFTCTGFGTCSENKATVITDSGLALAPGGGLDVALTPSFSLRAVQFDYIRTHMDRNQPDILIDPAVFPPLTSWQKNYRFATGIVFRLGERSSNRH